MASSVSSSSSSPGPGRLESSTRSGPVDTIFAPISSVSSALSIEAPGPQTLGPLGLGSLGYRATIKLFDVSANETIIFLGPWEIQGSDPRRVVWQCSYTGEVLEHFLPSCDALDVFPLTLHANHRRFADPRDLERFVEFTDPHRIRYTTPQGVVHDEYIQVRYEFITIDYSIQWQSDVRTQDLVDWFDVDVIWSDQHPRHDSYGTMAGLGTMQRVKLWRDRHSATHYITFYASCPERRWKQYRVHDFEEEPQTFEAIFGRIQLDAREIREHGSSEYNNRSRRFISWSPFSSRMARSSDRQTDNSNSGIRYLGMQFSRLYKDEAKDNDYARFLAGWKFAQSVDAEFAVPFSSDHIERPMPDVSDDIESTAALFEIPKSPDEINMTSSGTSYSATSIGLSPTGRRRSDEETLQLPLEKGTAIDKADKYRRVQLLWAAKSGNMTDIQLLLNKGVDIDTTNAFGQTALFWAVQTRNMTTIQLLLKMGAAINIADIDDRTPLSCAVCEVRNKATISLLLEKGADVEKADKNGRTPLSWAVGEQWNKENIQLLLKRGATVDAADKDGRTPLSWAAGNPYNKENIQLLLDRGAAVNTADKDGRTPLSWAAGKPYNKENIQLLLDRGAAVNAADKDGRTPLVWAVREQWNKENIQLLLERGATVDAADKDGRTPLSWAVGEQWNKENIQLLLKRGATVDAADKDGRTPLSWATRQGYNSAIVMLLLENGAVVNATDKDDRTLLSRAAPEPLVKRLGINAEEEGHQYQQKDSRPMKSMNEEPEQGAYDVKRRTLTANSSTVANFKSVVQNFTMNELLATEYLANRKEREQSKSIEDIPVVKAHDVPETTQDEGKTAGAQTSRIQEQHSTADIIQPADLPMTLPELIDTIAEKLLPPPTEPPVPPGKTRVKWTCNCGESLFDDFTELKPGALESLEPSLRHSNISSHETSDQRSHSIRQPISMIQDWAKLCWDKIMKGDPDANNTLPRHNAKTQPSPAPSRDQEILHLLLCIDMGELSTTLYQERLGGVNNDQELFDFLRKHYFKRRKFWSWFTLRSVRSLALTRFKVDNNAYAEVHKHGAVCATECVCLPPLDKIKSQEYRCTPEPEYKLGYYPAIGSRQLTHYFLRPHCFAKPQRTIYNQLPKRSCGQLAASTEDAPLGWGIHFDEGWHWRTIYFIIVVLLFLGSLVFGITWSITKGDLQGAFAIAGVWMTAGSLVLGYLAVRS